jgi:hypothetical protein
MTPTFFVNIMIHSSVCWRKKLYSHKLETTENQSASHAGVAQQQSNVKHSDSHADAHTSCCIFIQTEASFFNG